jgi:hypothetical protein
MSLFDPFYDPSDLSACVPANSSMVELNAKASKDHSYFPLWRDDSESFSSLYLNTRVCSRSFRFGGVGDNVLGLRFKLKDGRSLELGGRVVKNVVGFDFTRFLAGSLGRFGEPETLILRLRPLPEIRRELALSGTFDALEGFRADFMRSAWVHAYDAFDFETDSKGMRLHLAYACTKDEAVVYTQALEALALGHSLKLAEAPLPIHAPRPARTLLAPLSQILIRARDLQSQHGGRISGYLGQGVMLASTEKPVPAQQLPMHPSLEAKFSRLLEALP